MLKRVWFALLVAAGIAVLSCAVAQAKEVKEKEKPKAERKTVTGTVEAAVKKTGEVKSVKLTGDDGVSYSVQGDARGKELGAEMNGKKVEVVGDVVSKTFTPKKKKDATEEPETKTVYFIKVVSYKALDGEAGADADGGDAEGEAAE